MCRVRVAAGEEACPSAGADERATLDRIGAPADVRLACQLRPRGNASIIPLVRTEQPTFRRAANPRSGVNQLADGVEVKVLEAARFHSRMSQIPVEL
jgi:hypothetical protein